MIYAKSLDLLENHEIRALVDNETRNIGKLEMPKCKKHVYADCGKKKKRTISIRRHGQEGKGNIPLQ
jgi:threonyl-tRNA synthetase